jgi:hypothetical protein
MVNVSAAPEKFIFSAGTRAATIETAVRVAPDGRIVGFGTTERDEGGTVVPLFPSTARRPSSSWTESRWCSPSRL